MRDKTLLALILLASLFLNVKNDVVYSMSQGTDLQSLAENEIIAAQTVIDTVKNVKELGIIVTTSEEMLLEAISAFESEDYLTAYEKASEAGELAGATGTLAMTLWSELQDLRERLQVAEDAGRTVGLDELKALLDEADEYYENGEYMKIVSIIDKVDWSIQTLSTPASSTWTLSFSDLLGDVPPLAILVTIIAIAIFMINTFRTKQSKGKTCNEK